MTKRIMALILALVMCLALCACGSAKDEKETPESEPVAEEEIVETEPSEAPEAEPVQNIVWAKSFYVDDFNEPTDEWYIYNPYLFEGQFSNSATTNSRLSVYVLVDAENISFMLYEYGRSQVKNSSSSYEDYYDITMKDADGNKVDITGSVWCGGDRLVIDEQYRDTVINALSAGDGTVSFYIVERERATTTYLFTVQCANFAEVYSEIA